ncbi:MAG: ASKHA domain-containing protein [Anaerolineae bacterium]
MPRIETHIVTFEPIGRRIEVSSSATLLEAAQTAGVELVAVCGGIGACHGCMVRATKGRLSPVTLEEESQLGAERLAHGWRLACQAEPLTNVRVDVPPESLTAPQRLLIEGERVETALDPVVTPFDIHLAPASLEDLRGDARRLIDALPVAATLDLGALRDLPRTLRATDWTARLARRDGEVVAVLPPHTPLLGLAVDIGTTSLAAYLVDLETGETLAKSGAMNPQIAYGEDVVSRIVYCAEHPNGSEILQSRLIDTLNELIARLCAEGELSVEQIVEVVLVGNTVMHHLALDLPVASLGEAPYTPVIDQPFETLAARLGLHVAPGARVYFPANIAGYVGADHVAALVASALENRPETALVVDIGTNTEMTLTHQGRLWSCSCASGPAFEGAHIRFGMRAAPGAIERVQILDGVVHIQTIGHKPASGICGSGILDAVAEMTRVGLVDSRGAFVKGHPLNRGGALVLAPAESAAGGEAVTVGRSDVAEIQLAKAAIRTGIDLLLAEARILETKLDSILIAGAFGTYIQVESAVRVGMFPALPRERYHQVGNAAGMGACQLLVSRTARRQAARLAEETTYLELTVHDGFQSTYMARMALDGDEIR